MLKEKEKRQAWTERTGPIGRTRNRLGGGIGEGKGGGGSLEACVDVVESEGKYEIRISVQTTVHFLPFLSFPS